MTNSWVKARAACSALDVFKELELEVHHDVEERISILSPKDETKFAIVASPVNPNRFSVMRVDDPIVSTGISVNFIYSQGKIIVQKATNQGGEELFTATVTLNNEGQCRLWVKEEELEKWQFRRKALESLFFE